MHKIWTSLKKYRNVWIFLGIILLFGIGVGIYFGFQSGNTLDNTITNYVTTIGNDGFHFTITHFIILTVLLISSFFLFGIPLAVAYLFYEGITIGFCITLFMHSFGINGFFYMILFFLITKVFFLLLYAFYFTKLLSISKGIISMVVYKTEQKDKLIHLFISCFVLFIIMFVFDLFLDLLGVKIVSLFSFLLR